MRERDITGGAHETPGQVCQRIDAMGAAVAALRPGPGAFGIPIKRAPAHSARRAHSKTCNSPTADGEANRTDGSCPRHAGLPVLISSGGARCAGCMTNTPPRTGSTKTPSETLGVASNPLRMSPPAMPLGVPLTTSMTRPHQILAGLRSLRPLATGRQGTVCQVTVCEVTVRQTAMRKARSRKFRLQRGKTLCRRKTVMLWQYGS